MIIQWRFLLFSMIFLLAACGLAEGPVPTPRPATITPTPISTPLPYPTPRPAVGANAENPIEIVIVPADAAIAAQRVGEFESALQALTDVVITVTLAESDSDAYNAVCSASQGIVAAALLDGMSFVANSLANCGVGVLQTQTDTGTGEQGVMLVNIAPDEEEEDGEEEIVEEPTIDPEATVEVEEEPEVAVEVTSPELVSSAEGVVCRIAVDDLYSWALPVLYYGAQGVQPDDIVEIVEVADNDALIADLISGDCDAGGMSLTEWEAYLEADEEGTLAETVAVAVTSPEIPFKVFSFSSALSLEAIADIEDALLQLEFATGRSQPTAEATEDPDASVPDTVDVALLEALFGQAALVPLNDERINELFDLFDATGVDFMELGN